MSTEQPSGYLTFEDMCWPDPRDPRELGWRVRYAPESLTRRDQMVLSSIISAYAHLISLDSRTRQKRVMQIRTAQEGAPL